MDIRRLELDSKHVDKHKSKYTGISSLSIDVRKPKSVIMVKPLWAKGDSGKLMRVNDVLVNMHALRKLDARNLIIDTASTKNVLVQDLSPYAVYLSSKSLAKIATQDLTVTSLDVSAADISNVNISSIGVSDVGVNSISIADLGVSPLNANSLAPYVV